MAEYTDYAARLEIDYPEKLDRLTTFFRLLWIIPIAVIFASSRGPERRPPTRLSSTRLARS